MMFVHLRTHSHYSFMEGASSPADLAQAAARSEMAALALTDHKSLSGAVEFYDACHTAGVQPILGLELEVSPPNKFSFPVSSAPEGAGIAGDLDGRSLVFLAMDSDGWSSLCRLSSALHIGQAFGTRHGLPFEILEKNTTGLLCLTGGRRGLVTRLLRAGGSKISAKYLGCLGELFPQRLYVELQNQAPGDQAFLEPLASLAKKLSIPVVAANSMYYLQEEQASLGRLLAAIRLNTPMEGVPEEAYPPPGSHFVSPAEMVLRFAEFPESIAATQEVAERCQLKLSLGEPHFPEIQLPPGVTPLQALRQKVESGARKLFGEITPEISARLDHELQVIGERGYAPLFLVMEEVLAFARQSGIPVSSRGSAASSLVAHCLGITSPNPLRLNLYFERFLNPARATPPDIDTDLCSRRRDEVIRFVYERFGEDRVAMVCTVNRFRRRSALRETAKAYGLPPTEVKTLTELLPYRWWAPAMMRSRLKESPFQSLVERYPSERHQTIFKDAVQLIGLPRHLSIHPGGVVISPGPMTDLVPTLLAAKGVVITQFDLESVERLGLVKIDLLGIRGLTVLGDVAHALQGRRPQAFANPLDALEAIPEDDEATSVLVQSGRTIGCFQIESPGMQATLKEIRARSVDDIMVALALFRPGPLTGGLRDAFVRRYRGQEPAEQLHPALETLLADTYGVILYQEQVLRIANELAGFSLVEADLLRRAMSHFDPGEKMRTLKEKFIAGARTRAGVSEPIGERIWQLMAAFAGYGFPKAHAASYAQVAWRAAWCKAHEPAVFMAAVLANWGGYYSQRVYLTEARRMGLALRPPDVNHARREFSVSFLEGKPALFMGLDQVRDLTRRTQERIIGYRPYHSLADFLTRVDPRPVEVENLARAGALEGFGNIPYLISQLGTGGWRGGQLPLFGSDHSGTAPGGEDWSLAEKMLAQEAILGVSVVAHPLELVADQIASAGALSTVEAAGKIGQRVRVAGVRQTWQRSRSVRGEAVYLMALEDLEGMLEVVISAEIYRRYRRIISATGPYIIEGEVALNQSTGEPFIHVAKVELLA